MTWHISVPLKKPEFLRVGYFLKTREEGVRMKSEKGRGRVYPFPSVSLSPTALPDMLQWHDCSALSAGRCHVCGVRPVGHQPAHWDHFLLRGNHNFAADNIWMQVRLGC